MFSAAQVHARLQAADKQQIPITDISHFRGYQRLGTNVTNGRRDWHEAIDLYREVQVLHHKASCLP